MFDGGTRGSKSRQLFVAASACVFVLVVLLVAASTSSRSANWWVEHTLAVRQETSDWVAAMLDAQSSARAYVSAKDAASREAHDAALRRADAHAITVRQLVSDNPAQLANVDRVEQLARATVAQWAGLFALVPAGQQETANAVLSSRELGRSLAAFREQAARVSAEEARLLIERRALAEHRAAMNLVAEILLALGAVGLLRFAWWHQKAHVALVRATAAKARGRLAALSDIATALSDARTRQQVADIIVSRGRQLAGGADVCTLYELDVDGTTLELIGERGVAPGLKEQLTRITDSVGNPDMFARLRSGKWVWAENEAEYLGLYPALARMKVEGPRAKAFWGAPLLVESRPVGILGMGFYEPRTFDADERAFIETFTNQCAQALVRASALERENATSQWFTTTLRSIGDAVIATDAGGCITFMNPVAEALTRWTEGDARGRPLDEVFAIFSEETRQVVESPVAKVLREGKIVGLANHTVLRPRQGPEIPIDDSGAPIRTRDGALAGVVLVFRDVTTEKRDRVRRDFLARAGEALVSSLDYQSTLGTVARLAVPTLADWCSVDIVDAGDTPRQVAVAHVDPMKVQFARDLSERYPPDHEAPTGAPHVIRTGRSELYPEIPAALLEAGAKDAEHLRLIKELRLASAMVVPLRARGRTLGAMTFVFAESGRRYGEDDLSFAEDFARRAAMAIENALALKAADDARAREGALRGDAEIASRAKDDFLATVSHELRTPLNAILGWTVILRRRQVNEEVDRGLGVIERNARAQAKLIEDVLDVSRIISGKLTLALSATNVGDAVRSAIETVTPAAEARAITLSSEVADGELTVTADPDRLQQVVWNLLSNAVKFTPKGGHVSVNAERRGSHVSISVTDTGEGIRREVLPLIFEPFQQGDASTTRRHGGLGLGLAIVKQLVSAHGGTVSATSEGTGKGATFTVQIPARAAVPAVSKGIRSSAIVDVDDAPPQGDPEPQRLDGLRLLIVDDEPDALDVVGEVLRECGAAVDGASSAEEAMQRLERAVPDVIVSDIGMPLEDGYAFIRKVRALPPERGGRTPAVALTAYARSEDVQRAYAAGFQKHVPKPVELARLTSVIADLAGRSQESGDT
jgi:PAS domain S-box-containing protein